MRARPGVRATLAAACLAAAAGACGDGGSGFGAACHEDDECATGLVCLRVALGTRAPARAAGTCVAPGRLGERCYRASDCRHGLRCVVDGAARAPLAGGWCQVERATTRCAGLLRPSTDL
jgi:hypothetical protein